MFVVQSRRCSCQCVHERKKSGNYPNTDNDVHSVTSIEKVGSGEVIPKEGIGEAVIKSRCCKITIPGEWWCLLIFYFCKFLPNISDIKNIQTLLLSFSNSMCYSSLSRQEFFQLLNWYWFVLLHLGYNLI